ncbi:MAG: efflux RND transporter permease subunit [Candidatus Binataceae bacterium]
MRLVRFALRNPYVITVGVLLVVVLGLTAATRMPVDILPQFTTPAVQVVTFYPGMPVEVMEKDITTRLERWTGQSAGIARQKSRSMLGVSIVKDFFHEGVDPASAIAQVSSYAMSDLFYLPPGTIPPMVMPFDPTATLPLALITVSSPVFNETKLYDVAYFDLRNRLQGISGVVVPAVYGGKLRRILAYVDRDKLQARDLSPMDVVRTLKQFSTLIPTGDAKFGNLDYQILTNGIPERVSEMNDFPIKIDRSGAPVLIRDVGEVEDTHAIQTNIVRISAPPDMRAKRQVYIPVYRQPGANTIAVVDAIRAALPQILTRLPKGINLSVVMDQSFYVREAIRNLSDEAVIGAVLAALVMFVFIAEWRSTIMVAFAIPLSILAALIGLYFTGNSINAMTLGGLALAVGRLIDDAIIVIENTHRYLDQGTPPAQAAMEAAGEVAMPVFAATISTIVIFFPVVFLTGIGKFLFTPLAVAVAFAIAASYLVAMTVVPVFSAHFLTARLPERGREPRSGFLSSPTASFETWFEHLRQRYEVWVRAVIRHSRLVVACSVVAFVAALFLSRFVGRELFPDIDAGQLTIQMHARSGLRIERTEQLVARVEDAIKHTIPKHDLHMVISNIGVLLDWPAAYTPNAGPQDAFLDIQLTDNRWRTSQDYVPILRRALNREFPGAEFSFYAGGLVTAALNGGLPSPIDIQVTGNSLGVDNSIAQKIRGIAAAVPGAADARIEQHLDYPAIDVKVDRTKAAYLGLTPKQVVENVVTAFNSSINFDPAFWIDPNNGNHYFMGAQYFENAIKSVNTLKDIPITAQDGVPLLPFPPRGSAPPPSLDHTTKPDSSSGTGRLSLLENLATFTHTTAPSEVEHLNISRVTDVYVNVQGRDLGSVASDVEARIASLKLPAGYSVAVRGVVQSMRQSFQSLFFALALAAVLIYLVMVAQFRSFLDPFVIMLAVPLEIVGVVAILLFTGTTFNIQSFLGVIFVVGIAVSNEVLIVDFASRLAAQGRSIEDAVVEAAKIRMRPIVMTSLATLVALVPMAIGLGHGSEANIPLARAVLGGFTVATLVSLFVVPMLYVLFRAPQATRSGA